MQAVRVRGALGLMQGLTKSTPTVDTNLSVYTSSAKRCTMQLLPTPSPSRQREQVVVVVDLHPMHWTSDLLSLFSALLRKRSSPQVPSKSRCPEAGTRATGSEQGEPKGGEGENTKPSSS